MKTTKFLNLAAAGVMAAAMGFAGCDSEQTIPVLEINPAVIEVTTSASAEIVEVTSTAAWSSAVSADAAAWCIVSPDAFAGNKVIMVSIMANLDYEPRSATITFTSGTLKELLMVNQAAAIKTEKKQGEEDAIALCDCLTKAGDNEAAQEICFLSIDLSKMPNLTNNEDAPLSNLNEYEQGFLAALLSCSVFATSNAGTPTIPAQMAKLAKKL
jgi:hypothetical protein